MIRTHNCGELNKTNVSQQVTLSGWVQKSRNMGGLTFVDLRDRYGITQLTFNAEVDNILCEKARKLGREYVIQAKGEVVLRSSPNKNMPTGDIEINVAELQIINQATTPPFTIESVSDGGDELRMKYRFLDLRRDPLQQNIMLRHRVAQAVRQYLSDKGFLEIETPFLIRSTPEGARDFVVPSRMHTGSFYALPQSPQTFKQLLMVSGFDKYFQIVKCFRDEDLRADRQPEFTQIDCEMSFVTQEDILETFEGLLKFILQKEKGLTLEKFERMSYAHAMRYYGSDKPDLRFDIKINHLLHSENGDATSIYPIFNTSEFAIFNQAKHIVGINVPNAASYTRKQTDELIDWVKRPQIGAKGLLFLKYEDEGVIKSSFDKFCNESQLNEIAKHCKTQQGDLLLLMTSSDDNLETLLKQIGTLRLEMAKRLGLLNPEVFKPLWVIDFPMFEVNEDPMLGNNVTAMHHPFTRPKGDIENLDINNTETLLKLTANAYDLVLNGSEIAGGSIRIHEKSLQEKIFELLGLSKAESEEKFGFLLSAFEYGAPPHGGIAFGFDRLCSIIAGADSIRDFIAFPKNNAGRDTMLDAPAPINEAQSKELGISTVK